MRVDISCIQWLGVPFRDERKTTYVDVPPNFLYALTKEMRTSLNLPNDAERSAGGMLCTTKYGSAQVSCGFGCVRLTG